MSAEPLLAGIELGGTKCIAVLARGRDVLARERLPTRTPEQTLTELVACLRRWQSEHESVAALGLASFGPLSLDPTAPDFGRITTTPKAGWAGVDLLGAFANLNLPLSLDTDVNAAALAEGRWGASRGARVHVYLTIGTGIGGGVVVEGRPVHGLMHPEMGHLRIRRSDGDGFAGICPYHGDCLEGLASGPAIAARVGAPADSLAGDHSIWRQVGTEIGELVSALLLLLSPERVVVSGGVGSRPELLTYVIEAVARQLSGYLPPCTPADLGNVIRPPELGPDAGALGAVLLASSAV